LLDQLGILLQLFNGLETALWSIVAQGFQVATLKPGLAPLRLRLRAIAHRPLPRMQPLAVTDAIPGRLASQPAKQWNVKCL
jgi:hypothetical protein